MSSSSYLTLSTAIAVALAGTVAALPLHAQTAFPATLAGHVVMPAQSFIAAPKDASDDLKISGKFTSGERVDAIGTIEGLSAGRPTGVSLPFNGQPIQGHSGIKKNAGWQLLDIDRQRLWLQSQFARRHAVLEPLQH